MDSFAARPKGASRREACAPRGAHAQASSAHGTPRPNPPQAAPVAEDGLGLGRCPGTLVALVPPRNTQRPEAHHAGTAQAQTRRDARRGAGKSGAAAAGPRAARPRRGAARAPEANRYAANQTRPTTNSAHGRRPRGPEGALERPPADRLILFKAGASSSRRGPPGPQPRRLVPSWPWFFGQQGGGP